jgi:hypothetical protein
MGRRTCSDQASSVVRAAGKSARSKPAQRCLPAVNCANSRAPWSMTLAARFPAGHCGGGVSGDCCRVCRWSPCCGPRYPRSTPGTRAGHTEVPGSRIAPVVSDRCARWRQRACALRRSGAGLSRSAVWRSRPARDAAPAGDRRAAVGWPDHTADASSPTPRITSSWSRRAPTWLRRGAPAPPSTRPRRRGLLRHRHRSGGIQTVIATTRLAGRATRISPTRRGRQMRRSRWWAHADHPAMALLAGQRMMSAVLRAVTLAPILLRLMR